MFLRACKTTMLVCLLLCMGVSGTECPPQDQGPMAPGVTAPDANPPPDNNPPPNNDPPPGQLPAQWNVAFDTTGLGALSSVWGSGPNDVYVVGGSGDVPPLAEMYHYDGAVWRTIDVSGTGGFGLVWVYGFGPSDVYAVGLGGTVLHYDGTGWTKLNAGTTRSLWGIWGSSPTDIWIVGEGPKFDPEDPSPTIIHYDGSGLPSGFTAHTLAYPAENDRDARSLFKVWGVGSKVFAVGAAGLIVEYDATSNLWFQVFGGANANEDFVSLWGTSDSNIVAVGGRSGARISDYNGSSWTTVKPSGVGGLNAVFMDDPAMAIAGGVGGYVCHYDPATNIPVAETAPTTTDIHAIWGDGAGRYYAVGGDFSFPFSDGVCLVRTYGDPGITPVPPVGP